MTYSGLPTSVRSRRKDPRAAEFVATFSTESIFSMYAVGDHSPVCLRGRHAIHGEIYHLGDTQVRLLDELEWYPDVYQRFEISTHCGDAWMYTAKATVWEGKELIPGRWP
ncbi:gamma-glutamylcyclotransferase [Gammaproteobacteria bacterium]|nr:gamma-glutamylcyclotransferase [Gammaproteobacteria bacterium]